MADDRNPPRPPRPQGRVSGWLLAPSPNTTVKPPTQRPTGTARREVRKSGTRFLTHRAHRCGASPLVG